MKNLRDIMKTEEIEGGQLMDQGAVAHAEKKLQKVIKEEPAVRKVVRASARLADFITQEDREENARVIREAANATMRIYSKEKKDLVEVPDHKTRLAAATLRLAYDEGTPVKRSVTIASDFHSADEVVRAIQSSPEASRALAALSGLGLTLEADGEIINTIPETVNNDEVPTEADG
jgi:hypothetical protein